MSEEVLAVLRAAGTQDYIGEAVSQLTHALQAAHFAAAAKADEEVVLAALLHDIGHLIAPEDAPSMAGLGIVAHERIGADYLRRLGFSERVALLVEGHVNAKRYLLARRSAYAEKLSEASRGTLRWQGGPMSDEEADRFEANPLFADLLRVRAWDEAAKDPDLQVASLESYWEMMERHSG